jgi:prepilin peptidase CpaA
MPAHDLLVILVAVLASATLIWGGVNDIRTRKIPNLSILTLLVLFVPWTALDFGTPTMSSLEAAGLVFGVTVALYAFGIFGAGDSKMFTGAALFMGMGYLPYFLLMTALAGGVFAILSLAARPQRALVMFATRGRGDFGEGVPYGAAIAIGGVFTFWAMLHGDLPPYAYGGTAHLSHLELAHRLQALGAR